MTERGIKMIKYPLYVTLDTNIFVANKFDFSKDSTLGLLVKYVKANKIKIVLSNIVIKEVEKHIVAESDKICGTLRKLRADVIKTASEEYLEQLGLNISLQILDKKIYREKSREIWNNFVDSLKPEILDTSKIDLDAIITDYFNVSPPFENSDKKRKEFPDAFIANQIKERFDQDQVVAIVSDDNGFKRACGNSKNHIFYKTLAELYDAMNRQEAEYRNIVQNINSLVMGYIYDIESLVMDNDCVEVHGQTYDTDGIVDGFDYSEITVVSIRDITCGVRTIDEITEETVLATLLCTAEIDVECSYEDYDNAAWDHETESYYFLETRKNHEKPLAGFGIRVGADLKTNSMRIIPFKVILNGDTLRERFEIDEDDSEMDLINQEREELGFCSLDRYSDYLEDNLAKSSFMASVISIFKKINSSYREYEEVATIYDDFVTYIKESRSKNSIKQLAFKMDGLSMFPISADLDTISDKEIDEVILWADQSYDRLSELSEQTNLPDCFNFGEIIEIHNGKEIYKFVIDEFVGTPSVGDEELIDLSIKDQFGTLIANGYVKLIVGYLDFDEDGGAGDGIEDDIEYCCEDVVDWLANISKDISECVKKEWIVAKKIEAVICTKNEIM